MTTYTQGICEDGAAILKDGVMMTVDEIVAELNSLPRWIPVTERLPDGSKKVMATYLNSHGKRRTICAMYIHVTAPQPVTT